MKKLFLFRATTFFVLFFITFFLTAFIFLPTTFAAVGAVSTATGGSGRGAIEPIDGVLLNPATISDLPSKHFSYNYSSDQWALTVVDNGQEAYLPAALKFIKTTNSVIDTQQLGLSFASRRWKKITVGMTVSMFEYTNYLSSTTEQKYRQTTADLAATYALATNFGVGFVANKIGSSQIDLAENLQTQKTLALGLSYTYQKFARLRFDIESAPENKTDRLVYMLGLENYLNDWVVFRLGYQNNNVLVKNYFTTGIGFAGPQFGLHYAYFSNTADKTEDKHLFDIGIPF